MNTENDATWTLSFTFLQFSAPFHLAARGIRLPVARRFAPISLQKGKQLLLVLPLYTTADLSHDMSLINIYVFAVLNLK